MHDVISPIFGKKWMSHESLSILINVVFSYLYTLLPQEDFISNGFANISKGRLTFRLQVDQNLGI